ncbi:MAG: putative metallopeptidase [Microcoleus sp.]
MKPNLVATKHLSFGDEQVGSYKDCPQPVYDVLSMALATDEHRSLNQYSFRCSFFAPEKGKGKKQPVTVKILGDLEKLYAHAEIQIIIDFKYWMEHPEKQEILLFRELCRLILDEDGDLTMTEPDIVEFYAVYARYGDWQKDLAPIAQQLNLLEESLA